MKKRTGLLALLLVLVMLAGCGGETATSIPARLLTPTVAATATVASGTATTAPTTAAATITTAATATAPDPTAAATNTTGSTATSTTAAATATEGIATATAPATTSTATVAIGTSTEDATPKVVAATNAFLATLSDSEKSSVMFDWTDEEQKANWSNLPQGLYTRDGLMWGDLSETQQNAWLAVMQVTLSEEGYNRVLTEWEADDQLSGGGNLSYGTQYYWIAVIGTPSATDPWQWQWGGHHVTVNATIVGSNIALTPSFIGCQPCEYTDANGNTVRPLGDIEDEAFELLNSLDATQQQAAILGSTYIDLVLGPGQDSKTIASEGLSASQMTEEQKALFVQLIGHYTGLINDEDAAARMAEVEADLADTYFAWYGPTAAGSAGYFRITGPTIVIEYSPQSMGGNAANHIHGIYRDPTNDYGAKYTQ